MLTEFARRKPPISLHSAIFHDVIFPGDTPAECVANPDFYPEIGPKREFLTFSWRPLRFPDSRSAPLTRFFRKPRKAELREISFRWHTSAILTLIRGFYVLMRIRVAENSHNARSCANCLSRGIIASLAKPFGVLLHPHELHS